MSRVSRWQDLVLPLSLIASVLVIIVPLPAAVLDVLLATNITLSVIVLLTTVYVRTPLEFNIFPSMLLATTLGRLVLNVWWSTRLILTHGGHDKMLAAGGVIKAFGEFVAGDQLVVGVIIFAIIVLIQFVVITKGATRISEVAARFALDGMPGRQMAIDADMNAGLIDEKEAQRRREEITQQADFYGAMDGASKFVRGDAIAGIVITIINIVGGFVIGVFQEGMSFPDAAEIFTKLTIGDGLVSQVPAFLISLAAGLLVTRSTQKSDLPAQFMTQLFNNPRALAVTSGFLGILVFTNLPKVPLLALGVGCGTLALMLTRQTKAHEQKTIEQAKSEAAKPQEERIEDFLAIDPMEIEIGAALVKLASPKYGGDLLPRITAVRQGVAADIGIILPKVRIRDNIRLGENEYRIKISNNPVAQGEVYPGKLLALDSGATTGKIAGIETKDPAFQQPALWIDAGLAERAQMMGYTPVEPTAVLATHLQEIVRRHADELLTRDATKHLLDELKKFSPAVVDELIPNPLKLAEVQQVLQMLLREEVPIRQLSQVLETLGDYAGKTKDLVFLVEYVRHRLARTICTRYRDAEARLFVLTLDPALEDKIAAGIEHTERGLFVRTSPQTIEKTCEKIGAELPKLTRTGKRPIVLVSPQVRAGLKQMTTANLPRLIVMSFNEITRDTKVEIVGIVNDS